MIVSPKPVSTVQKILGASARKVLVVEGPTDLAVYSKWFDKLAAPDLFGASLELVEAGGKNGVLACLRWFADNGGEPRVFGLVDRDEWDAAAIARWRASLTQLWLNHNRHSIESYFCDPDEIFPSLATIDPAWGAYEQRFRNAVSSVLADYVRHWALLCVTDRLKTNMNEQGYPGQFSTSIPIPPDADIQARFRQWVQTLDPTAAFAEFDALRQSSLAATLNVQFRSHVWAKLFFENVIAPLLNNSPTHRQRNARDWLVDLAENGPAVPADIEAILRPLL